MAYIKSFRKGAEQTMPKRHHHSESQLNHLSVNADPEHPVYREAVNEIQKRLRYMTDKHSQVFVGHLEFRFPPEMENQNDNRHISNAIRKCRMKLKREGIDAQLVWAREQRDSEHPHYHCYPVCDGNKVQLGLTHFIIDELRVEDRQSAPDQIQ